MFIGGGYVWLWFGLLLGIVVVAVFALGFVVRSELGDFEVKQVLNCVSHLRQYNAIRIEFLDLVLHFVVLEKVADVKFDIVFLILKRIYRGR